MTNATTKKPAAPTHCFVFVHHRDGATHMLGGKRARALHKALLAGTAGEIVTSLVMSGYEGFMRIGEDGPVDFEYLTADDLTNH